jgi:predicted neuraminidase
MRTLLECTPDNSISAPSSPSCFSAQRLPRHRLKPRSNSSSPQPPSPPHTHPLSSNSLTAISSPHGLEAQPRALPTPPSGPRAAPRINGLLLTSSYASPNVPCWNPVLFHSSDGKLWLYYKFGPSARTWTGARLLSTDEAHTWSPPDHLPAGLLGPIKDKPLVLHDGTIVSGASVESYSSWASWIDRSTDNGRSWTKIGPITVPPQPAQTSQPSQSEHVSGIIQPTIVPLGRKHLRLYARSTSDIGRICVADSFDNGLSWTQAHATDLPNPNSGIDAVALRDGRVVLIYNNTTTGRTPLNLAISADGEHFKIFETLEDQPGEYSYPAIIQGKGGELDITYTWNRKRIRFATVPLANIPDAKQSR